MRDEELGLYVHVPFCVRKCPYCAFASSTDRSRVGAWLAALEIEADEALCQRPAVDTIYVGGGTPSAMDCAEIERLFAILLPRVRLSQEAEVTIEVNPADATGERLAAIHGCGVNRLSLGVQSLDNRVLRTLGRRHDSATALAAIDRVQREGFGALSLDLIYGVPAQSRASWHATLRRIVAKEPDHLSCYMLTVEPGTPLAAAVSRGQTRPPSDALLARRFRDTSLLLGELGYGHYEVSSFARSRGRRSRHNGKYWRHAPYLGLGPAAHSFTGRERWWNTRSVEQYVSRLLRGASAVDGREQLEDHQIHLEAVALGLRTSDGIAARWVVDRARAVEACIGRGWLVRSGDRLRPTTEGLLFADHMAVALG